ncbi:Protein of unknown function [Cotesia congregata]|uniref:Uncharacterized protein n=1 Tax=Cotesia congregata TaxID=51543 RepID=A0A8J2MP58_COTCN|nr:Protein of unknown function [Cotesia congregata]
MKSADHLFLLCVLFGASLSGGFSSPYTETELYNNSEVITNINAIKKMMETWIDVSNMCNVLGICYDVKFVTTLSKKKHDNITKIELNSKEVSISHNCSGFYYNNKCYSFPGDQNATKKDQGVFAGYDWYVPLYVCRISIHDYVVPGKLLAHEDWNNCYAPVEKFEINRLKYELLVGSNLEWTSSVYHPDKAIYGGYQENGLPYLICRANHTSLSIGKIEPPYYNTCSVPWGWRVHTKTQFDVLVQN